MLPSLCRAMAAIEVRVALGTSRSFRERPETAGGVSGDSHLASVPLAGSIGTWIVARLYSEGPGR